ncbi:MAG: hypothetical protein ACP5QO_08095 [Clostridia bacterium]
MKRGAILDRVLKPAWLDAACALAAQGLGAQEAHRRLDALLGPSLPGATARSKTRTALAHIWLTPPGEAAELVRWATQHFADVRDTRFLHLGAMMACYPFFADVCTCVGRALGTRGEVVTPDVRRRLRRQWGDTSTVDVAARRAISTLRAFGALTGVPGASLSQQGDRLIVPDGFEGWVLHALLVARQATAVYARDASSAPELFMMRLPLSVGQSYSGLQQFTEGHGTLVLQARIRTSANSD